MNDPLTNPSASSKASQSTGTLSPDEQIKLYIQVMKEGIERLPVFAKELNGFLEEDNNLPTEKALPVMHDQLERYREELQSLEERLNSALGNGRDPIYDDVIFLRKRLEVCQQALAETQQKLYDSEERSAQLQRSLDEREQFIQRQQAQIGDLQKRNDELTAKIQELEQRTAIEPAGFGKALGEALDSIQQGLTALQNPLVDFAVQELDLQTNVNLQVATNGQLLLRFPGLNEEVAPQNLSQLEMHLRPIPKNQQLQPKEE